MSDTSKDELWMQLAIQEARKGLGLTSPNPAVGAVVVKKDQVLGTGWHQRAGSAHAERQAIKDALKHHSPNDISGATIYVTLEPCCSHGQTPPCTDAIIEAGISRVVYATKDPNPRHAGRAERILMDKGIEVNSGICELECRKIIRAFGKVQKTGLPWVILKSAMSIDGRTTRPPGESQWLSSPESREFVQQLRYYSDAIITGGNTLRIDNPALTLRSQGAQDKKQPWRMVITEGKKEKLPLKATLFNDQYAERTLVQENGDLHSALNTLVKLGCTTVMVEAGGKLMAAFLDAGLADELVVFYAPLLTGGPYSGFGNLTSSLKLEEQSFSRIGSDIVLRASIVKQ